MLIVNKYTAAIVMKMEHRNHDGDWDPFLYLTYYLLHQSETQQSDVHNKFDKVSTAFDERIPFRSVHSFH